MAVMRILSMSYTIFLLLTIVFPAARIVLSAEETSEEPLPEAPSVHQCRSHIEAALRAFITKKQDDPQSEPQTKHQTEPQTEHQTEPQMESQAEHQTEHQSVHKSVPQEKLNKEKPDLPQHNKSSILNVIKTGIKNTAIKFRKYLPEFLIKMIITPEKLSQEDKTSVPDLTERKEATKTKVEEKIQGDDDDETESEEKDDVTEEAGESKLEESKGEEKEEESEKHKSKIEASAVAEEETEEEKTTSEEKETAEDGTKAEEGKEDTAEDDLTEEETKAEEDETKAEDEETKKEDEETKAEDDEEETKAEESEEETKAEESEEETKAEDDEETKAEDDEETKAEDDEETKAEDDEETKAEDDDEETKAEDDDEETKAEEEDEETKTGDEEETKIGDEEETKAEDEEETKAEDDEETKAEDDEETKAEDDEETKAEDDEETKAEDDEETKAEDDEETKAEEDEETKAEEDEETKAEEDEQTKTGDEEETKTDEEETKVDEEEETKAEEGDEETKAEEGDEETKAEEGDEETKTEGDEETKTEGDEETKAEEGDEETKAEEDEETVAEEETKADTVEDTETKEETSEHEEGEEAGTDKHVENEDDATEDEAKETEEANDVDEDEAADNDADSQDKTVSPGTEQELTEGDSQADKSKDDDEEEEEEDTEAEEITESRSHDHITRILGLDEESMAHIIATEKVIHNTLKELKKMYENAVKPMEGLYKFKDISNRFVGDAELFSKPMILFIGPWSSGKSAIINYLLDIEDTKMALRTGAEPQSNGFTVLMYGETEQMMDGIEVAADWTFSSLQKFGQTFQSRLQGVKLPNNLLRRVTIVDTPGILENRKQQERTYPFNDACQWFIDRADIIYVVFDPAKLDMGLEMEALFDQLKGREAQVRIVLNKADSIKPQELMRVQSTLLWNLSPLLGSTEPPIIFVGTFWSKPYLPDSPETLFNAQEDALLQDLRQTIDGRVENKISFTRRHAVRVRNHAKMVDCYLRTYYDHKTFFSNKKKVADEITENPQNYHIYEGLSTLTNVSRYDLPDPDIYRDFFRVNPLYEFKLLASTCSFFKGCPLDRLDITIAYDLPELMGKYRKQVGTSTFNERR